MFNFAIPITKVNHNKIRAPFPIPHIVTNERLTSLPTDFMLHLRVQPTINPFKPKIYTKLTTPDGKILEEEENCCYPDCSGSIGCLLGWILFAPIMILCTIGCGSEHGCPHCGETK